MKHLRVISVLLVFLLIFACSDKKTNHPPIADAGADITVTLGGTVELDGSKSFDDDDDEITFLWAITEFPAGSTASLSNETAVNPTFVPDMKGFYTVQLVVNDGEKDSEIDSVIVTVNDASENTAPVANAGEDQVVEVGGEVALDGSGSSDEDGDALFYEWKIISKPEGSAVVLSADNVVNPIFIADVAGSYEVELKVFDSIDYSSTDVVKITASSGENTKPVADAGLDKDVAIGEKVVLDGSGSNDLEGDTLTYSWSIKTAPEGSTSELVGADSDKPEITVDLAGEYVVELVVNDGLLDSDPDSVTITVTEEGGLPKNAAKSVVFLDTDTDEAQIGGIVTVDRADVEDDITHYVIYFGTDSTTKGDLIAEVAKTETEITAEIAADTALGANTHILVFTKNENGEMETGVSKAIVDIKPCAGITIKDVQDETSASHPAEDESITVCEVVVTSAMATDGKGFFVSDIVADAAPYTGVYVYGVPTETLGVGDKIRIAGTYKEFFGLSEISTTTITKLGTTAAVPNPAVVSAADVATDGALAEQYEGVLVKVENEIVAETNLADPKNVVFKLDGGLYVEDILYEFTAPSVGEQYTSITGILHYDWSNFKLLPRDANDMVSGGAIPQNKAASVSFEDTDFDDDEIGGTVTVERAAVEDDVTHYVIYFGTDEVTKGDLIAEVAKTELEITAEIPADTAIGSNTHILVFTKNDVGMMATSVSDVIQDETSTPVPKNAAVSVLFEDVDANASEVGGTITVTRALDESDITHYAIYFGTNEVTKGDPIAEIAKTEAAITAEIPADTAIGTNTHILVFTKNANGEMATGVSVEIEDLGTVTWCRTHFPKSISGSEGQTQLVYGRVKVWGVTDLTSGTDTDASVLAKIGYGADASDPATDNSWIWVDANPNANYNESTINYEVDVDEYILLLTLPAEGVYDYAFKFSADGGSTWAYCDTDPDDTTGDANDGTADGYQIANAGSMTVASNAIAQNGGFEIWSSGAPDSWTTIDSGITVTEEVAIVHGGSKSASVNVTTGTQANTDLWQTVTLIPGKEYVLSVWVYHTEGYVKARAYGGAYGGYSVNNATGLWQELTYTFTANEAEVEVGLRFYDQEGFSNEEPLGGGGEEIVYVDDFSIEPVQ